MFLLFPSFIHLMTTFTTFTSFHDFYSFTSVIGCSLVNSCTIILLCLNRTIFKKIFHFQEEGLSQRFVKDPSSSIADKPAAVEMSQGSNISLIVSILAAIIALIIGCLIGKFLL